LLVEGGDRSGALVQRGVEHDGVGEPQPGLERLWSDELAASFMMFEKTSLVCIELDHLAR